jgi:dUTP pyrophosphatase
MIDKLKFLRLNPSAILPTRASESSAGLDLYSVENVLIESGNRAALKTGLAVAVPDGFYGRIAPRSGLALSAGIDILAGVVDSDYRGELLCILINHGQNSFAVSTGDRIAQLIIERIIVPVPEWATELASTARAEKGFGSTDR